jgi:hypothetical protein
MRVRTGRDDNGIAFPEPIARDAIAFADSDGEPDPEHIARLRYRDGQRDSGDGAFGVAD